MTRAVGLASAFGFALLTGLPPARAQTRPTVVELFTSEGCNSCPPAEAMLGVLAKHRPDVIAIAFHVDYWDYIGWKDRFEIVEATQRQHQYAHALHLNSVYTPQLVIDGQRDVVGNNDPSTVPASTHPQAFPLDVVVQTDEIQIRLGAGTLQSKTALPPSDVLLVSYLPEGTSKVTRGENAGHELHEFNIVRSIKVLGSWSGEPKSFNVSLKSLPPDATQVAVLVQARDAGPIIGAAAHALR